MSFITPRLGLPTAGETLYIRVVHDGEIKPIAAELRSSRRRVLLLDVGAGASSLPAMKSSESRNIEIVFVRQNGLYRFTSSIRRSWPTAIGATVAISEPRSIDHFQRRREVRVPLRLATTLVPSGWQPRTMPDSACIVDLSAVGARIRTATAIRSGSIVTLDVPTCKDGEPVGVKALVLDCIQTESQPTQSPFESRLQFHDGDTVTLPDKLRDSIAAYLFEQQRQALKVRRLIGDSTDSSQAAEKKTRTLTKLLAWMRVPSQRWKR